MPDDKGHCRPGRGQTIWQRCYADGRTEVVSDIVRDQAGTERRDGTAKSPTKCAIARHAEIAKLKAEYEKRAAAKNAERQKESGECRRRCSACPGADDASNCRFAESLMKVQGWRSATLQGQGRVRRRLSFRRAGRPGLCLSDDAQQRPHHPLHHHPPAQRRVGDGHGAGLDRADQARSAPRQDDGPARQGRRRPGVARRGALYRSSRMARS